MADIIVVGAGIGGSTAALLLARDGHSVTLLDRDPGPLPIDIEDAWAGWDRRAVGQFRMPHILLPRGTAVLYDELPDVATRLALVGGLHLNLVDTHLRPCNSRPAGREDDRFDMLTGRRPTLEWVIGVTAEIEPTIAVRRGVAVDGLLVGSSVTTDTPHVVGVRLDSGEELAADLVVDATGRNSPTVRWLAAIGSKPPTVISEDSGFAYYGRFFTSDDGSVPELRAPLLTPFGSVSILTIPSDNDTWATMLYATSDDKPLRKLRDPGVFESVVRAFPLHAHWMDGKPISAMASMVGATDRKRRFMFDGEPIVTGMLSVGDAAACSNPSLGRGMSFALMHAVLLRDVARKHLDDHRELAREFDRLTESELGPWYDATQHIDRARVSEMRAAADGNEMEPTPEQRVVAAFATAASVDLTAARAWSEVIGCLTTVDEVLAREGLLDHVIDVASSAPAPPPAPDRAELIELVQRAG